MIKINNCITKILSIDKNNSFAILTYLDFEKELTPEFVFDYVNKMVNDNPILKKEIIQLNNNFMFKDIENYDINNHINIKYIEKDSFNQDINSIINNSFVSNTFFIVCYIDKINKVSRVYFKINHAYTDGYKLINMLTKPIFERYNVPEFKRTTSVFKTIYHYIIGTIILLVMNIKIFLKIIFSKQSYSIKEGYNTDFIICKPFMLDKIKKIASNNGITINDFLYSLMVKTDKLYTGKNRNIQTCSPINLSKLEDTNNMCPLFNSINNSLDDKTLLQQVHNKFDNFKYSLFIPFLSFIINNLQYININIISVLYESVINDCDYVYSNMIGPPKEVNENSDINLSNIHFLTKSKGNLITFNIISYNNNINIICSFNKGKIKDKKRFEKCIYKAYNNLINIDNTGFA